MEDAVGDCLTNCMIYLELHNSYWPDLDLGDDDETCWHCGELDDYCACNPITSEDECP